MTTPTHRHAILERCDRAVLTVCDHCHTLPFFLRTRNAAGGLQTKRVYADRDAAMWAYHAERTKGVSDAADV
jgi:hypothetical protein